MTLFRIDRGAGRWLLTPLALASLLLPLGGCFDSSSSDSEAEPAARTGPFMDSPVAGLDYQGTGSQAPRTDGGGQSRAPPNAALPFPRGRPPLCLAVRR